MEDTPKSRGAAIAHVVDQRTERETRGTTKSVREFESVHYIEQSLDVRRRMLLHRTSSLFDASPAMGLESIDRLARILEWWSMSGIHHRRGDLTNSLQRTQIIRHTARILGHPGRVALTEEEVTHEECVPVSPGKAQVLGRVAGRMQRHQVAGIRAHHIPVLKYLVDLIEPFGAVHPSTGQPGERRRRGRMVTVAMREHDCNVLGSLDPGRQSPDVVFHVRARVDDRD